MVHSLILASLSLCFPAVKNHILAPCMGKPGAQVVLILICVTQFKRNSVNRVNQKVEVMTLRVEPTASSNVFLIHGKACAKSEWHPTCSLEEEGVEPLGKLYAINFKELMGDDWRVSDT